MGIPIFLESLNIGTYKNIRNLEINNFKKINIISGKNNVGKTTILEALFLILGAGNPTLPINILQRRIRLENLSSFTRYLFNWQNDSSEIRMRFKANKERYSLDLKFIPSKYLDVKNFDQINSLSSSEEYNSYEIIYSFKKGGTELISTVLNVENNNFVPIEEKKLFFNNCVFLSSNRENINIERYSSLMKSNEYSIFDEILREIEPKLIRTTLLAEKNQIYIAGDVGFGLVHLSLLGGGLNNLANILLGIITSKNGVFLIDEIENGLHYSYYEKLWKKIYHFSEKYNVQVFATTHSFELIIGAYNALQEKESSFQVMRIEEDRKKTNAIVLSGEEIKRAIEGSWEIR